MAPTVTIFISGSFNSFLSEKRYSHSPMAVEFKCKLGLVVCSRASCTELELFGADDKQVVQRNKLSRESAWLGSHPDDGCRILVIDQSGAGLREYEDVSRVEKYKLS